MVDIKRKKVRKAKVENQGAPEVETPGPLIQSADCINEEHSDDEGVRPKSVHVILRPDEDDSQVVKISDKEKKNFRKQMIHDINRVLHEEGQFEDSKAALLAAADATKSKKPQKKDKVIDEDE